MAQQRKEREKQQKEAGNGKETQAPLQGGHDGGKSTPVVGACRDHLCRIVQMLFAAFNADGRRRRTSWSFRWCLPTVPHGLDAQDSQVILQKQ